MGKRQTGFTLVELLVTITIMAILAAMILFGLASAEEAGRAAKTQGTIAKLHVILMDKYESYRTRRLPVDLAAVAQFKGYGSGPRAVARARVDAMRDLMRLEMPDRFSDFLDNPITRSATETMGLDANGNPTNPAVRSYRRAVPTMPADTLHQGAECLYMLVQYGIEDPDTMEQFRPNEVADTDGDGLQEFVDGWQRPISFLRWAPGFTSPMQPGPPYTGTDHDQFDPLKVHKPATGDTNYPAGVYPPLFPLVYSGGSDKSLGIVSDSQSTPFLRYATRNNDPYAPHQGNLIGSVDDVEESADNITNQLIESR